MIVLPYSKLIFFLPMAFFMAWNAKNIHKGLVLKKGKLPVSWKKAHSQAVRKQIGRAMGFAVVTFVLLSFAFVGNTFFRHEWGADGEVFAFIVTLVVLFFFARKFIVEMAKSNQHATALMLPSGDELLASDKRTPILYLRSFKDDWAADDSAKLPILHTLIPPDAPDEADLCMLLFTYGPVVAVGRPREELPPLGASRLYFGDNWKEEVTNLMNMAQIIVLLLGNSTGIKWELSEAFKRKMFEKLLLIFPPRASHKEKNELYQYLRNEVVASEKIDIDTWPNDIGNAAALIISHDKSLILFDSEGFLGMNAWQMSLRQAVDSMIDRQKNAEQNSEIKYQAQITCQQGEANRQAVLKQQKAKKIIPGWLINSVGPLVMPFVIFFSMLALLYFSVISSDIYIKSVNKDKVRSVMIQIENMSAALDMYRLEVGSYPTTSEGLNALITKPSDAQDWNGPYLKKGELSKDAWGNDYIYRRPGMNNHPYDLMSLGADGLLGGEGQSDNLSLWQQ